MGLMVSEKKIFFFFFHYKSMGANEPRGVATLDPRGLIGRIYLLHIKYISCGPHVLEMKTFKFFPLYLCGS